MGSEVKEVALEGGSGGRKKDTAGAGWPNRPRDRRPSRGKVQPSQDAGNPLRLKREQRGQRVVYPCNGILFSQEKGWGPDMCSNVNEPQKLYAK